MIQCVTDTMIRFALVFMLTVAAATSCFGQDSTNVISGDSALKIADKSGGNYYKNKFRWRAVELLDTTGTIWTVYSYKSRHRILDQGHPCNNKRWERTIVINGKTGEIISRNKRKYIDTNCPPNF
jgi:hypothetical protein